MMTVAIETPVIEDTAPNIPVEKPTFNAVKQKLLQIKGVRQVFEIEQWIVNDPETQSSALNINVFPCSFVEEFQLFKNECVPGQLLFPDKNFLEINMVQKYFLEGAQIRIASDSISGASTGTFTLPPMRLEKVAVTDNFWTSGLMSEVIMTDSSPLFSNRVSEDHLWIASTVPGFEVQEQIYQAARSLNPRLYIRSTGNQELIESYERSQFVLRGLTGIALMIAIFALLVTTIDRSRERQREFTMQRVGGISSRIVKSAQYLQVVLPFFIGSVVAGIVSLLASQALLHVMIREKYDIQWSALYVTVSLSLLAAFITVLALSMSVGSKINPANLRRE
jgi:hypothetical protein